MAAAISLGATTAARGSQVAAIGTGFSPGRTEIIYLNGAYVGVAPTNSSGAFNYPITIPAVATGSSKPVMDKDSTDITVTAITTLTVT